MNAGLLQHRDEIGVFAHEITTREAMKGQPDDLRVLFRELEQPIVDPKREDVVVELDELGWPFRLDVEQLFEQAVDAVAVDCLASALVELVEPGVEAIGARVGTASGRDECAHPEVLELGSDIDGAKRQLLV